MIFVVACGDGGGSRRDTPRTLRSRIDELQRIKAKPQACEDISECPAGSYCDVATGACDWECLADSDCGELQICSETGTCIAGHRLRDNADASCDAIDPAARRDAILVLAESPDGVFCFDHADCPCGSYCDMEAGAICRAECLAPGIDDPPAPPELELTCGAGEVCSSFGECVLAPAQPPPPFELTIELVPGAVSVRTGAGAVSTEVSVRLITDNILALAAEHDASLTIRADDIIGPGVPRPLVKCDADDDFAETCVIDGDWHWDLGSGDLRSQPKRVWIEVPQVDELTSWTISARSQWAGLPGLLAVEATPVLVPETDPGRYAGTMTFANGGAVDAANQTLSLPVEAVVTDGHVAIIEPTGVLLAGGQITLARDPAKATMAPWLETEGTSATYDVRFDLQSVTYDASVGHLAATVTLATGTGASDTLALSLDRTEVPVVACGGAAGCGAEEHCDAAMGVCLPGAASIGTVVDDAGVESQPSRTLGSALYQRWKPALAGLVASAGNKLGGTGRAGFERAYCFASTSQPGPATLNVEGQLAAPSQDLRCRPAIGEDYAQTTVDLVNHQQEYVVDGQGVTFDLFSQCIAELTSSTTADPLGAKRCVSLARFFLALDANAAGGAAEPMGLVGQRLVHNLLRQWLSVTAYVANTAVQLRNYEDVLASTSDPAHERLGGRLDVVESALRVFFDPRVRAQYRAGVDLVRATHSPDYRRVGRPFARWTFNDAANPGKEVERGEVMMSLDAEPVSSQLRCNKPSGHALSQSQFHADGLSSDDGHFSIVMQLGVSSFPRNGQDTFVLFDKEGDQDHAGNRHRLWVEAKTNQPGKPTASLNLTMKDSEGGVVVFPAIPGDAEGQWSLVALVADGDRYKLYQQRPGQPIVAVEGEASGGGVRWGEDGDLSLRCDLPTPAQCASWHRFYPGDYQGGVWPREPWHENRPSWVSNYHSPSIPQAFCNNVANGRRNQLLAGVWPDPPASAVNAFTVTSGAPVITNRWRVEGNRWDIDFSCPLTISQYPQAPYWWFPICGGGWGSGVYTDAVGINYDEVSLWNRALTEREVQEMWARYAGDWTKESLPADTVDLPGSEQATALPAHMLEAAGADLALLVDYIDAERDVLYEECRAGGDSAARDRVLARVGRNLRLVALIEGEARYLAELPGVSGAPWYARYQAAHRTLAGRRTLALRALELAFRCENPLGITEEDVPLFTGQAVGSHAKFFASTQFLIGQAQAEATAAGANLAGARAAYLNQRQSHFQVVLGQADKALRSANIRAEYEGRLRQLCGVRPSGQGDLLTAFQNGTLDATNCFLKTEVAACADLADTPLTEIPASCVRGELGNLVLALQGAHVDQENASRAYDRAHAAHDTQTRFCIRQDDFNQQTHQIMAAHEAEMKERREERQRLAFIQRAVSGVVSLDIDDLFGPLGPLKTGFDLGMGQLLQHLDNETADLEVAHQLMLTVRESTQQIMACYHQADMQRFSIDAQRDMMRRAAQATAAAVSNFETHRESLRAIVDEASGRLAAEERIDRAPPHFHFWLAQEVEQFHRHMRHARRLTYLALRAFEHESQWSPPLRGDVLAATLPAHLTQVLTTLGSYSAPVAPSTYSAHARPLVLSLRDEILRLHDLSGPGSPSSPPERKLRDYLLSDHALVYNDAGQLLGRGIRFTLKAGDGYSQYSCAERIWRVSVSLQTTGGAPTQHNMVLRQSNAFASQRCTGLQQSPLVMTRVRPSFNLLLGEAAGSTPPPFVKPTAFTAIQVDGPPDLDREPFIALPENPNADPGLAGRGLFGEYVLLFGSNFSESFIENNLDDVLIRFDIVELTNG